MHEPQGPQCDGGVKTRRRRHVLVCESKHLSSERMYVLCMFLGPMRCTIDGWTMHGGGGERRGPVCTSHQTSCIQNTHLTIATTIQQPQTRHPFKILSTTRLHLACDAYTEPMLSNWKAAIPWLAGWLPHVMLVAVSCPAAGAAALCPPQVQAQVPAGCTHGPLKVQGVKVHTHHAHEQVPCARATTCAATSC